MQPFVTQRDIESIVEGPVMETPTFFASYTAWRVVADGRKTASVANAPVYCIPNIPRTRHG